MLKVFYIMRIKRQWSEYWLLAMWVFTRILYYYLKKYVSFSVLWESICYPILTLHMPGLNLNYRDTLELVSLLEIRYYCNYFIKSFLHLLWWSCDFWLWDNLCDNYIYWYTYVKLSLRLWIKSTWLGWMFLLMCYVLESYFWIFDWEVFAQI